jgi:hypothetical protein
MGSLSLPPLPIKTFNKHPHLLPVCVSDSRLRRKKEDVTGTSSKWECIIAIDINYSIGGRDDLGDKTISGWMILVELTGF